MDTSAWIAYLAGRETEATGRLAGILYLGVTVGLTRVVLQEVVQGVSSKREFDRVSEYLGSQIFTIPKIPSRATAKPLACTSIVVGRGSPSVALRTA